MILVGKKLKANQAGPLFTFQKILKHILVLRFGKNDNLCIRNSVSMVHRLREGALTRGADVGLILLP